MMKITGIGALSRAESQGVSLVARFFADELPRTFRANWRYMALAFAIFAGFGIFGFIATWTNLDFTHFVGLSGITTEIQANDQWWLGLNKTGNQIGASFIMSNNILVTVKAFAMGALLGVGAF